MQKSYFNSLNYTLGNEDSSLELEILPQNTRHIFAVSGSGSRIIPLLAKNPELVTCVDVSIAQLFISELRMSAVKSLDYHSYLGFLGYSEFSVSPAERKSIFKNLDISLQARKACELWFEKNDWKPLLYEGRWEKTFKKLSKINRGIVGKKGTGIFACRSIEEQDNYLKNMFPKKAWAFSVFLLGNASVFNALLYKGHFPKKNIPEFMSSFYLTRFHKLFLSSLARENFFLQMLFFGEIIFSEGLPVECSRDIFIKAKAALNSAKIIFRQGDIITLAKASKTPIDFVSMSDTPSYFKPPVEQEFLQEIKQNLRPESLIVNRYYLRIPENLNTHGFCEVTPNFKAAIEREKTQMYSFGIFKRI